VFVSFGAADIQYEFESAGKVLHVSRDYKARCALVEFDRYSAIAWDVAAAATCT
jgi:hypothetical protein